MPVTYCCYFLQKFKAIQHGGQHNGATIRWLRKDAACKAASFPPFQMPVAALKMNRLFTHKAPTSVVAMMGAHTAAFFSS